jgi:hypothetical protein
MRWSFVGARFRVNPWNFFGPVTVHPERVLGQIPVPAITFEENVAPETLRPSLSTEQAARRRCQIPAPCESAVSLQAYVKQVGGICPLCGHAKEEDSSDDEETGAD